MSALRRDPGMSTRVCLAVTALRIRVSISAIGSVISFNLQLVIWSDYQLLFVTPVMSPSSANLRKHRRQSPNFRMYARGRPHRSEEHTSELQSHHDLVCRLLLEKKKKKTAITATQHIPKTTLKKQLQH